MIGLFDRGKMEENNYYCYIHCRKDTDEVFYVGHGRGPRCSSKAQRSKAWQNIALSGFYFVKLHTGLSKQEAIYKEKELILNPKHYWSLVNEMEPYTAKAPLLEEVKSVVYYSETSSTGLRWTKDIYSGVKYTTLSAKKGAPAGCFDKRGYAQVKINKKLYSCHRLVYLLCNGNLDTLSIIDHIDGNKSNNCKENLRQISQCENTRNKVNIKPSNTGVTGICRAAGRFKSLLGQRPNGDGYFYKSYSIKKYGEDCAMYLAAKARYGYLISQEDSLKFTDSHSCLDKLIKIITDFEGQGEHFGTTVTCI